MNEHDQQRNDSEATLSVESLMKMPPGIYVATTTDGKKAVIKVSPNEPVVNVQVVLQDGRVEVTEYYTDGKTNQYEKTINI